MSEPRWPDKGDCMIFLGENGYPHELAAAMKIFKVGKAYLVEDCEVGDWCHHISFVGIPGRFNGVMFDPGQPKPEQGQIWREVDTTRGERHIRVECVSPIGTTTIRTVKMVDGVWTVPPRTRAGYPNPKRFNGKWGGYRFVRAAP